MMRLGERLLGLLMFDGRGRGGRGTLVMMVEENDGLL